MRPRRSQSNCSDGTVPLARPFRSAEKRFCRPWGSASAKVREEAVGLLREFGVIDSMLPPRFLAKISFRKVWRVELAVVELAMQIGRLVALWRI